MADQPIYNITDTWNSGTTQFWAVKVNVTDTASAANSRLMDLQVGGVSQFHVGKNGSVTATGQGTFGGTAIPTSATLVTTTRQVATGTGLTGGGDLSADRTIALTGQTLALHNLGTNGLVARTGAGTVAARSMAVSGTGLTVTNADGVSGNPTITSNATNANTASTIVARDASGNFSAGTITAALSGNATTATTLQTARTLTIGTTGKTFNGSANVSWSLAEIGAAAAARTISAGTGLTGGGDLTTDRTLALANMATGTIKGRASAGTGAPEDLTPTQVATLLEINDDNRIINGDFGIWQRGTIHSSGLYGSADRWRRNSVGGTAILLRVDTISPTILGGTEPPFVAALTVSDQSAASHFAWMDQIIEDVRSYSGQTITVLGWAARSTGAGNMAVEGVQTFGSGGSPLVQGIGSQIIPLTGVLQPFAATITLPDLTGKTLGPNHGLAIRFWASAGSDFNTVAASLGIQTIQIFLWGIHIRRGVWPASAAALYRPRHPAVELAMCQRYYWRGLPAADLNYPSYTTSAVMSWPVMFPVAMRAVPVLSSDFTGITLSNTGTPTWMQPTTLGARLLTTSTAIDPTAFLTFASGNFLAADAEL